MAHQLILFSGGVMGSDSQPSPGTVSERDASGDTYDNGVNASGYISTGALYLGKATYTAATTVSTSVTIAECNATSAAFTLTLPACSASAEQFFVVIKIDSGANAVTIAVSGGSDKINGATTYTGLTAQWDVVRLYCDGAQWLIV